MSGGDVGMFFANYPTFNYNPRAPVWNEFDLLVSHMRWRKRFPGNHTYLSARQDFCDALIGEFNNRYGTNDKKLDSWQGLCAAIGIRPIPRTITKCRKAIRKTHINICDLVDIHHTDDVDAKPPTFRNIKDLKAYSRESHKIFPLDDAKAGGLLRHLLRTFDH